jgi:hypothetical protein
VPGARFREPQVPFVRAQNGALNASSSGS